MRRIMICVLLCSVGIFVAASLNITKTHASEDKLITEANSGSNASTSKSISLPSPTPTPIATCTTTTGYLNVVDCGATPNGGSDDTQAIYDAVKIIREFGGYGGGGGGKIFFPSGVYEVGTTDTAAKTLPIDLRFGVTIEGTNGAVADSNGNCRINLGGLGSGTNSDLNNKAIFRISNDVRHVTIRDIVLETTKTISGSTGILAEGDYPNSAFDFLFSNMGFRGFDVGFDVKPCTATYRALDGTCRNLVNGSPTGTDRYAWQFDQVQVDHVRFYYNKIGIRMDTNNTDWNIISSWFDMVGDNVAEPTTAGLYIKRGGAVQINNTFAGGIGAVGGNFIYVDNLEGGPLQIINSQAENVVNSIVYGSPRTCTAMGSPVPCNGTTFPTDQDKGTTVSRIVVTGSEFGSVLLRHRVNFVSTGNHYGPTSVVAYTPLVRIYSMGDKFCQDGYFGTYDCSNSGFKGIGQTVFSTGQPREGTYGVGSYNAEIPNRFGLPVEITGGSEDRPQLNIISSDSPPPVALRLGHPSAYYDFKRSGTNGFLEITGSQAIPYRGLRLNGLLQFDPNITYADLVTYATTSFGGVPVISDGAFTYCKDCEANVSTGNCQAAASGGGAFAKRINGVWKCN